jgi:hypothetical protein
MRKEIQTLAPQLGPGRNTALNHAA